ncbi:MAG TPA: aldo/keto reductase, partial [Phycisphaerae bacterium]|nr:aldo/keto reductase [Phycisphaerae bacterium]
EGDRGREWFEEQQAAGVWEKVRKLNALAAARGQSMAQMALTWLLRDGRVTSVLIGVSRLEQLKENIAAAQAPPLSQEEQEGIEQILGT